MKFDIFITNNFAKKYLKKKLIDEDIIREKVIEIENAIFYNGEGRVKGSKILYKKRFKLEGSSKRRGGRLLFVVFQKVQNIYVPYSVWYANDSRKDKFDDNLKSKKVIENIIKETIDYMNN